ncbi:Gp138 family membrane-puncturing spike protein [Sporohalobacter salinus]|uniref:Gp138 family membrane-puncturing spike protein n=1 Tax=Sporohalobacter salinus TaxID=1494606 RepID=UPI001961EC34|nr:hypothetical protein [Sporohalobacter salinus]
MKGLLEEEIGDINVSLPAQIEKYYPEKMRADVTLLAKRELKTGLDESEEVVIPPILECPVSYFDAGPFIIRPPYQKDDVVNVVFSQKALDKLLITGEPESPDLERRHSLDDAIVMQGLKTEQEPDLNSNYTSDLLLENRKADSRIVMKEGGDLLIETNGETTVNSTSDVTVNAPKTTVNGDVDLASGGPPIARVGDSIVTYVSGGSSAGAHSGQIVAGSGRSTSG